jgi:flagellum-specific peptidoglycan hydrolase FlgJ
MIKSKTVRFFNFKRLITMLVIMFSLSLSAQTDQQVYDELVRCNIKHPKIVLAQAKLETGDYTSNLSRKHGNLFGLKGRKGYAKFNNWKESVVAYRDWVQYKYKGGDYYAFLKKIGYASDPRYIEKVKQTVKRI